MIVGNPFNFAVIAQKVEDWNIDNNFCNGVLFFCIDGELFPKSINCATLNTEQVFWKKKLDNIVINHELYNMTTHEAFVSIYDLVFPSNWDNENDYRFDLSPQTLCDDNYNCNIFAVSDGEHVRIMAANLKYDKEKSRDELNDISISEIVITIAEFNEIFSQIIGYINGL